ncbi:hypothetical protein [Leifsonia poae]|uniref:hypothetical protein n=1 Tax=Leifsonia poae TaxID=110933 RepID=UPI003D670C8A
MKKVFAWHRPLMTVAALMVLCTVICLVGLLVDHRQVTGVDTWLKPLKFSLSILLYSVTWAWLIAHLPRWRRVAHVTGTVIAVALIVEQVLIVGAAAAGTTSHFNVSTGFSTAVWAVMAVSITVLYVCTFLTTILVFFLRLPTPSLTLAVRAGGLIALVGMGLAYLMTGPTSSQLADFQGIAGAHTVGLPDGGPGLPCSAGAPSAATCASPTSSGCTPCNCCLSSPSCSAGSAAAGPCSPTTARASGW